MPTIGYYKIQHDKQERQNKFTIPKATYKSVLEQHLREYQNEYKHRLSNFSSFDFKQMANYSIEKQLGREKVGFLHEFDEYFKVKFKPTSNESVEINDDENFKHIHRLADTNSQTDKIRKHIKKLEKMTHKLSYENIIKAQREYENSQS